MLNENPITYEEYNKGTAQVLAASEKEQEPYTTEVLGREYTVLPGVFSPKYFHDTAFFAQVIRDTVSTRPNSTFLEIGPGTGVSCVEAALSGASSVFAVDINPKAVENTQINFKHHGVDNISRVVEGNIYDPIPDGATFDIVYWNTPFAYVPEGEITDLEKAVYDPLYKSTERFIKDAHQYLSEDGQLMIGFSSTLGRMDLIEQFLNEAGFDFEVIAQLESEEVHPVFFEVIKAKLK